MENGFNSGGFLGGNRDEYFMLEALRLALNAGEDGDVPIGACIEFEGKIIAKAWNQREILRDPTAHAEMIALTQAAGYIGNWRLSGCTMYVTLEPCVMCAGALVLARISRLVYACDDPKTGAVSSLYNVLEDERLNHKVEITSGVLQEPCSQLLKDFFKRRRQENRAKRNPDLPGF